MEMETQGQNGITSRKMKEAVFYLLNSYGHV